GNDRVSVTGATGRPPPNCYKVSGTYRAGYRASGTLTILARHAEAKARKCGELVQKKLRQLHAEPRQYLAETIGGDWESVLRITVADDRKEIVETFTRQLM